MKKPMTQKRLIMAAMISVLALATLGCGQRTGGVSSGQSGLTAPLVANEHRPKVGGEAPAPTASNICEGEAGALHRNPDGSQGGFVAVTAYAAPTATIGPNAWVCKYARVMDNAQVLDNAWITDYATVRNQAVVSENAALFDTANAGGFALIYGEAQLQGYSNASGPGVQVYGKAVIINSFILDSAKVHGDDKEIFITDDATIKGKLDINYSGDYHQFPVLP